MSDSPRAEFWAGVRAELPILLGVIPFGLIYGALATSAGLPFLPALGMSSIVFAGSAQFIGVALIGDGTPFLVIVLTTFVVNLRHALYSATLAPHLRGDSPGGQSVSRAWKFLLAYLLTDEAFAVVITHYRQDAVTTPAVAADEANAGTASHTSHKHWFFLGAGLILWVTWQVTTLLGIMFGARVPPAWGLDFVVPVSFIALVVPALKERPAVASAVAASLAALAAADLPYKLGLIVAAIVGIAVGLGLEGARRG